MEHTFNVGKGKIHLYHDDITKISVDAIVTPANYACIPETSSRNVQGAIMRAGGEASFEQAQDYLFDHEMILAPRNALFTDAGNLEKSIGAKYIVHAVSMHKAPLEETIEATVRNVLSGAKKDYNEQVFYATERTDPITSINFPVLGTGLFALDPRPVIDRMYDAFIDHLDDPGTVTDVGIVIYNNPDLYQKAQEILSRKLS